MRKEKKNADESPNIFIIIIHLPGRRQIIGNILQKKEIDKRESVCAY